MHRALYVEDILLAIFTYICSPLLDSVAQRFRCTADIVALTRTCQSFKEPALDILWSELPDLSPLARCLPHACNSPGITRHDLTFNRPLNVSEWDTLRGYTRRVRSILAFSSDNGSLAADAMETVFNPPFTASLFPKLQSLHRCDTTYFSVRHLASPRLTSLTLHVHSYPEDGSSFQHFLDSPAELCADMKQFRIHVTVHPPFVPSPLPSPFDVAISRHIRSWSNLKVVGCHNVALDTDAFICLSSRSCLRSLSFSLTASLTEYISGLGSALVFPNLAHLEILSESLLSITDLLSRTQFPVVKVLVAKVTSQPSEQTVEAYWTAIQNACPFDTLMHLKLLDVGDSVNLNQNLEGEHYRLMLDDIRPCTIFKNLRGIHISLRWSVILTDTDLLTLASGTPGIEHLIINDMWGWKTNRGITLSGLVQLLRMCPALYDFCLALNTHSFTQIPRGMDVSFAARPKLRMNVADSHIDAGNVRLLTVVLMELKLKPVVFMAWNGSEMTDVFGAWDQRFHWGIVHGQMKVFLEQTLKSETQDVLDCVCDDIASWAIE